MTDDIIKALTKEGEPSKELEALLSHCKGLVKMSRVRMSSNYSTWDHHDQVYRGEIEPDRVDREQARKGNPTKMVVPNTYAQIHTFSSFLFLMFNQNRTFFELNPTGDEDFGTKRKDCELVLERDLRQNEWNRLLFQHLTDLGRFGPAVLECSWTKKVTRAFVEAPPTVVTLNGVEHTVRPGSEWTEFVKYEGNEIKAVSPYRWFPDTRFPLVDFQRGEFCASEEEYSYGRLVDMEKAGEVAGVALIEPFRRNGLSSELRGGPTRTTMDLSLGGRGAGWLGGPTKSKGTVLVTKVQVRVVPKNFQVGSEDDDVLGPEEHQVLYHIWYANDNRIIKAEPAYAWHDKFSWTMSQFTPDMHRTVNEGLAGLIYRLQDVINWHHNSRITDVRRNMRGRNVVDPQGVELDSLDGEGDIILRKSASKSGVDRWIKQLPVQDVTSGHVTDADMLSKIMEVITGVNGNAMGQYNSGRRSAQEARVVTAGAAGRMKMHGHLIWESGLAPLGQMMLSNERQTMEFPSFIRMVGPQKDEVGVDPMTGASLVLRNAEQVEAERFAAFKGTPDEVICGDDYMVFDSTLASEKGFMAQSLNELLSVLLTNPLAAQQFDIDPKAVLGEMQELRNGSNLSRFSFQRRVQRGEALPPPLAMPQPEGQNAGAK